MHKGQQAVEELQKNSTAFRQDRILRPSRIVARQQDYHASGMQKDFGVDGTTSDRQCSMLPRVSPLDCASYIHTARKGRQAFIHHQEYAQAVGASPQRG